MKADSRQHMSWGSRVRFLARLLGITGALVGLAGALYLNSLLPDWKPETLQQALQQQLGLPALIGSIMLASGVLLATFAVVVEFLSLLVGGANQRGAAGINAAFQVLLATAIVGAVNVYAFRHEADFDFTARRQFTLPKDIIRELGQLKSETTIIVLQQHKTVGQLTDKPDRFDYAAERKVVEKVQDAVDLFRKFGPQFKVVVLDAEEDSFKKKFDDVTKDQPELRDAINAAPENSIFFFSEGHVQRMSFNEFYQLDRQASNKEAGNLVLRPQGIAAFVRRITAIAEKQPKVALIAMHPILSSEADAEQEMLSLAGARKTLREYGFETVDLILKKNYKREEQFDGEAAAYRLDENQLQRLEAETAQMEATVRGDEAFLAKMKEIKKSFDEVKDKPANIRTAVYRKYAKLVLGGGAAGALDDVEARTLFTILNAGILDVEQERLYLNVLARQSQKAQREFDDDAKDRDSLRAKRDKMRKQERAIEDRLMTDVKAKLTRLLSDCDMMVIPRITILNATSDSRLPYPVHKMKDVHIEVIKDFIKAGKPILVCAGPTNEEEGAPPIIFDPLEQLLRERGVELGQQTILFESERKAFTTRSAGNMLAGGSDVPPVSFEPPSLPAGKKANPLDEAMRMVQRGVDEPLNLKVRAPRPVYVTTEMQKELPYTAEFMWTDKDCWNEERPFAEFRQVRTAEGIALEAVYTPSFDPLPPEESTKNARDEERRGPFPIGVAFEAPVPDYWYDLPKKTDLQRQMEIVTEHFDLFHLIENESVVKKSRLVVIGQGGIFSGKDLKPATERLLLNTCNWLLAREDRLPATDASPWQYPRVAMGEGTKQVWHWGVFLGLPLVFIYLGLIVLMIRRVR